MKQAPKFNFENYYEFCMSNNLKVGYYSSLKKFAENCGG